MRLLPSPKSGWAIPIVVEISKTEKAFIESKMSEIIKKLGPGIEQLQVTATSIHGEWQGSADPAIITSFDLSMQEKFKPFSKCSEDGPVILYFHGGGYVAGSPALEREATIGLAKLCGGRVFALDYRLAPQEPFPAALIDAVVAYKHLIEPPPDALHEAIDPSKIVLAGDSAGVSVFIEPF